VRGENRDANPALSSGRAGLQTHPRLNEPGREPRESFIQASFSQDRERNMSTGDGRNILRELFRHNRWANLQIIEHCSALPDEVLDHEMVGAYGSPRATLLHLISAEGGYVGLLDHEYSREVSEGEGFPGFEALSEEAERSGEALEELAGVLHPDDTWTSVSDGKHWESESLLVLIQAINHGTEHREQIKASLSQSGLTAPELDGWNYGIEQGLLRETGGSVA
jgi:uncharacterized damage-inducible protein DinB